MVRRNLFQPPAPPPADDMPEDLEHKSRVPNTGAISGVRATMKDMSSNAVRKIAVDMIEESGPEDRLSFTDADVALLAESIKTHGQQVPIMVRPIADRPGRYRIVYGRRRLRALRGLGVPAKALVRSLTDEQAILAQGQENSQRLDPSFIEKALFAAELSQGDFEQKIILDALAVDKPMLSRMTKVARAIPRPLIERVGSAHGIGRRRWEALADQLQGSKSTLIKRLLKLDLSAAKTSEDRFAAVTAAAAQSVKAPVTESATEITAQDGTSLAEIKETARAVTIKLSKSNTPEFAQWLRTNAQAELTRLYEASQSDRKSD